MSRIRSAATLDRRTFLAATGAVGAATGLGLAFGGPGRTAEAATVSPGPAPAAPISVDAPAVPRVPFTRGTTLAGVATPRGTGGY
ncbi:twin-arginine translocation signal domain-containing protein, partial [Streptomyces lydicus]